MSHDFGIITLNKPQGISSRDAVNRVQRLARPAKVGHAGTLDPLASGVLVTCVGPATRLIGYVQEMPKHYTATFLLGRRSPTEDIEGELEMLDSPPIPDLQQVTEAAGKLTGRIMQRPPAYSALKVAGRRAYDLARKGETVELTPRPIDVYRFDVVRYEYPELVVEIKCGSGTYVRSLGRDLAESLGTAAVMSALIRTQIGRFSLDDSIDPDNLTPENWTAWLRSPVLALEQMEQVTLGQPEIELLLSGRMIELPERPTDCEMTVLDRDERLTSIIYQHRPGLWRPKRNFPIK